MSLCPGFIASQVLCVCNCYATVCATLCNCMQLFLHFFAIFCNVLQLFVAKKSELLTVGKKLQKVAKKVAKKSCNKLAKRCKKVAYKLQTHRTRDAMNPGRKDMLPHTLHPPDVPSPPPYPSQHSPSLSLMDPLRHRQRATRT